MRTDYEDVSTCIRDKKRKTTHLVISDDEADEIVKERLWGELWKRVFA